jgi:hypothetical protein
MTKEEFIQQLAKDIKEHKKAKLEEVESELEVDDININSLINE